MAFLEKTRSGRHPSLLHLSIPDMAPHPGIDTDQTKEKARKDLLDLLEGVCKASHAENLPMTPL